MAQQIEKLAHFVAETTLEQVPAAVQSYAKLVVLDTIGVILAGAQRPEVRELRARLSATAGAGATVFAPGWPTNDTRTAALLNGIAGRSIELGEGHRYVSYQGAMQILPGVLSVGEWARRTGSDMLAALILGEDAVANLVGDGFAPTKLLDELGSRWEITRNWLRLRACCNPIYAALDALEAAVASLDAKVPDVERIDVATFRFASVMRNPDPPNYFASKYSLPHVTA